MIPEKHIVQLDSLSEKIVGTLFLPNKPTDQKLPGIIICHGAGDFKENFFALADFLANHDIAVFCIDMHGHGESEGARFNVSMREWKVDVYTAIDFLENHPSIDKTRIGAFGFSSGGTAVLETAIVDPRLKALIVLDATVRDLLPIPERIFLKILVGFGRIKKAITEKDWHVPFVSMSKKTPLAADPAINKEIQGRKEFINAFKGFPLPGGAEAFFVDTLTRVHKVQAPTLILWGKEDRIDPPATAQLLYANLTCKKELHIIKGNGHVGHMDRNKEEVFAHTLDWLNKTLVPPSTVEPKKELLSKSVNVTWMDAPNEFETWASDVYPPRELVTAVFAVVKKNNAYLFAKYNDDPKAGRQYDFPGGHIEPGETIEQAVIRETFEEACVHVQPIRPVGYYRCYIDTEHAVAKTSIYPIPESYMAIVLCELIKEEEFKSKHETIARAFLSIKQLRKRGWREDHLKLLEKLG